MFLMRADALRGQVGGGWALEIERFFGPCEMASSRKASAILGPPSIQNLLKEEMLWVGIELTSLG